MSETNEQQLLQYRLSLRTLSGAIPRSGQLCGRYCNNYGTLLSTVSKQVNTPETGGANPQRSKTTLWSC